MDQFEKKVEFLILQRNESPRREMNLFIELMILSSLLKIQDLNLEHAKAQKKIQCSFDTQLWQYFNKIIKWVN